MVTSIFFAANQIQVFQGKLSKDLLHVSKICVEPLEEGSLVNGVITNEAAVLRGMENLLSREKLQKENFDLLVDAGSVLTKRLDVPIFPLKKLRSIAENEFAEVENNHDDLLYDFGVINRKNPEGQGGAILCAAMESSLAFGYIDLFKRLKLRLRSIDLAISCQIGLVRYLPELAERTFVLATLDNTMLTTSLYEKGQYLLSNRVRINGEQDAEAFVTEVGKTISSMIQFHRTQKSGEELTDVFLCGFDTGEDSVAAILSERFFLPVAAVYDSPAVRVDAEAGSFHLADYFYSVGNLLMKDGAYHG